MIYRLFADIILIIHFCFILFVVFGGFLLFRWRNLWKIHLPAVIWSFLVQYFVWICPLTIWENNLRESGGQTGYESGFIEFYLEKLIYPDIPLEIHFYLGFGLLVVNLFIYSYIFLRKPKLF